MHRDQDTNQGNEAQGTGDGAGLRIYAITTNIPGYSPEGDRTVAQGEDDAAAFMRADVDRILDNAVESGTMSDDEASSDLASIDSAIADGDLQYILQRDGAASYLLADLDLVVCATRIDASDLDDDEREWLDIDEAQEG